MRGMSPRYRKTKVSKIVSVHRVIELVEITKNKQITMIKIQNPKQNNNRFEPVWNL